MQNRKTCAKTPSSHTYMVEHERVGVVGRGVLGNKAEKVRRICNDSLLHSEINKKLLKDNKLGIEMTIFTYYNDHSNCSVANRLQEVKIKSSKGTL